MIIKCSKWRFEACHGLVRFLLVLSLIWNCWTGTISSFICFHVAAKQSERKKKRKATKNWRIFYWIKSAFTVINYRTKDCQVDVGITEGRGFLVIRIDLIALLHSTSSYRTWNLMLIGYRRLLENILKKFWLISTVIGCRNEQESQMNEQVSLSLSNFDRFIVVNLKL